jgi:hypothetical protein
MIIKCMEREEVVRENMRVNTVKEMPFWSIIFEVSDGWKSTTSAAQKEGHKEAAQTAVSDAKEIHSCKPDPSRPCLWLPVF